MLFVAACICFSVHYPVWFGFPEAKKVSVNGGRELWHLWITTAIYGCISDVEIKKRAPPPLPQTKTQHGYIAQFNILTGEMISEEMDTSIYKYE